MFQTDPASNDRRGELAKVSQVGKQAPDWLPADPHRSAESNHGTWEHIWPPQAPACAAVPASLTIFSYETLSYLRVQRKFQTNHHWV